MHGDELRFRGFDDPVCAAGYNPVMRRSPTHRFAAGNLEATKQAVRHRIKRMEEDIAKGHEYLDSGKHAQWSGFRPWFDTKLRDGKVLPPHRDWVKNVFLPRCERALRRAEKVLEQLEMKRKAGDSAG
jgi:hypothetical protein